MTSSSTQPVPDITKDIVNIMLKSISDGEKEAVQIYWNILTSFLHNNWVIIIIILFVIFIISLIKAILGRWGMFGKVLYRYIYFGILLIAGSIWGPDIFLGSFFNLACTIFLYPACYFLVGIILNKLGFHK